MTFAVFFAVLFAAVLHAGWNALVKLGLDRFSSILLLGLGEGGIARLLLPVFGLPAPAAWPWVLIGSALHSGYKLFLIRAYHHGDLSQVYPLARGTAPLIVTLASAAFLHEAPRPQSDGALLGARHRLLHRLLHDGRRRRRTAGRRRLRLRHVDVHARRPRHALRRARPARPTHVPGSPP